MVQRRTPRKRESPIVVTEGNSGRLSTSSVLLDHGNTSHRSIRTVGGSPIVIGGNSGTYVVGGNTVLSGTATRQRLGQQILYDGPTESRLISREVQEYTGPRTFHQQEVVNQTGVSQVVQVRAGTVKKEKVVEVPVIHHHVKIPVEIEVPREVQVQVPVPIQVPYPVEKIVEIPEVITQEVRVEYDVPVNVQVPTPYERIVENIIEKYIEVPGPTQIVEKLVHVPRITQVKRDAPFVTEVQVPVPVEHIRENIIQENIPVEHISYINEEYFTERLVPYEVEQIITKIVEVPTPYERIIEQIVEVPHEVIVHVDVPFPVERLVEKVIHVQQEHIVEQVEEHIVEQIEHVQKPVPYVVEKIIHRPREVIRHVHIDVPREKIIEKIVEVPVERIVERIVEVPVERIVEVPYEQIVEKIVHARAPWGRHYAPPAYVAEYDYGPGLMEAAEMVSTHDSGWREVYRSDTWKDEYDQILPPAVGGGYSTHVSRSGTAPIAVSEGPVVAQGPPARTINYSSNVKHERSAPARYVPKPGRVSSIPITTGGTSVA